MSNLTQPWGADPTDTANNKPSGSGGWDFLVNQMGNNFGNVVAANSGWQSNTLGGPIETLVAISGLGLSLTVASVENLSGIIHKAAGQVLKIRVRTNQGVNVGSANLANVWVVAISNDANVANVNLLYVAAESVPESGELVFASAATSLTLGNTSPATTLTINSISVINGNAQVKPRKPTHGTVNAATTIGGTANVVNTVVA
jgi:hypothetical protein